MIKMLFPVFVAGLLTSCASQQVSQAPVTEAVPTVKREVPATASTLSSSSVAADPLSDPKSTVYKKSVYFEYDNSLVTQEQKPLVTAHGDYMKSHTQQAIRIEGNCDERGSREYNLALGQRRADSVRKVLSVMGVADSRMETLSFGEEKPRATCHDDSCWKENRRADLIYLGK